MNVLLIQPPACDFYETAFRTQPAGLAYLASSLKAHGHTVEILDCRTRKKRQIPLPDDLSFLADFYPFEDRGPFKLFTGYYHFGMGWEEIRRAIESSKADVFGISSSFTPYHAYALEVARIIKERDDNRIVVMGGAHVSCAPEDVLSSPLVDFAVLGEGEERLPRLLEMIRSGVETIDGIGYRRGGEVRVNPLRNAVRDLDRLPGPALELLDLDRYRIRRKRATVLITSRGCPHGCEYCSAHRVMGARFRARSAESVIAEMLECRDRHGIRVFDIEDDNFTLDKGRAKKLMRLILETFGEGELELTAMNGVSYGSLDGELLALMKRAGFHTLNLSYVSSEPRTLEMMKRPGPLAVFDEVLENAKRLGLRVIAYAILGIPGQSLEEMAGTVIELMGKTVLIGPSVYYPTPGTSLFERCRELGALPDTLARMRSTALPIETGDFSRLDIVTLFRLTRAVNWVKKKIDEKIFPEGMAWREIYFFCRDRKNSLSGPERLGLDLLSLAVEEKTFFGLKKEPDGKNSVFRVMSSRRVLECFFEKAWERKVLGSI
jgi:radical SAM superfamily enzyme YgiQ (UPF0313 family)